MSIALEELGLPYEAHTVSFETNDQMSPEFVSLNPNNKIPAILDPNGPGGAPLALFESGAILLYLAEKTGQLLPMRLLGVLNQHLADKSWMMGDDFSIADIALYPWVRSLLSFYAAGPLVGIENFPHVTRVLVAFVARPAVARGLVVPA